MRQSLQSKFNVLGFLLIAFFLLMLPMFTQVKADTRESMHEAKQTVLFKWTNELSKQFKPPKDFQNAEVEDYWNDYQEQAEDAGVDAGNPDEDPDGDNLTNAQELEQGRNPMCNEEKYTPEYCANADKFNLTKPDDVTKNSAVLLQNITWDINDCQAAPLIGSCAPLTFDVEDNYTRLVAFLNASAWAGQSWSVRLDSDEDGTWETVSGQWSENPPTPIVQPREYSHPTGVAAINPSTSGSHSIVWSHQGTVAASQGQWNVLVYGIS